MKKPLVSLSSVLEDFFKKNDSPFSELFFLFQLKQNWRKIAGKEISKTANPVKFRNQNLILTLPDSAHLQEMHFTREALKQKISKKFPKIKIQKIILRVKNQAQ